jgi:hypothetical protein
LRKPALPVAILKHLAGAMAGLPLPGWVPSDSCGGNRFGEFTGPMAGAQFDLWLLKVHLRHILIIMIRFFDGIWPFIKEV